MTDIAGVGNLAEYLSVSFGLPILFICLALANITMSSRPKHAGLKLRLSLLFSIALFMYLIYSLMFQDRLALASIWQGAPVLYLFVYSVVVVLILGGIVALACRKLRPELWRSEEFSVDDNDDD